MAPLLQMLFQECIYLRQRQLGFWRVGNTYLEDMVHSFIKVQLHRLTCSIKRLIVAHEVAEKNFLRATLDQRRRKAFRVVTIYRRDIRVFLVLRISVGICRRLEGFFINVGWFGMLQSYVSIAGLGDG